MRRFSASAALDRGELLFELSSAPALSAGSREAVDELLGIAAVAAGGAPGNEHALLVPAAQFLDGNAQQLRHFLDAVFHAELDTEPVRPGVATLPARPSGTAHSVSNHCPGSGRFRHMPESRTSATCDARSLLGRLAKPPAVRW